MLFAVAASATEVQSALLEQPFSKSQASPFIRADQRPSADNMGQRHMAVGKVTMRIPAAGQQLPCRTPRFARFSRRSLYRWPLNPFLLCSPAHTLLL